MSRIMLQIADLGEALRMALSAIRTSKLRSLLTLLGIAVGVFSIISVMTAVGVLKNSIEEGMTQLGANTFQIQKYPAFQTGPHDHRRFHNRKDITYEQGLEVREKATLAAAVGLEVWENGKTMVWRGAKTNPNVTLLGENVDGITTNDWIVESGRPLSNTDMELARPVIILGRAVVDKLFPPSINPVGETVRIDGNVYQVIGVFAKKGSALGGNQDSFGAIPISTYMDNYGRHRRSVNIMVKALNNEVLDEAIEQARSILRTARKVPPGEEDDFAWFSNDSLIKQFNDFTLYLRMGVLLVSSIALLAAGVGIMNIMLVSVTERTREIGIRKAIGAQRSDILQQFIIEAVLLSELGGLIGIVFGILGGNVVGLLLEVPAIIPWDWAMIGLVSCSVVGLVFGVYPAWKAAMLDPIEALRYE